jgi:hypothetical protein
VDVLLLFPHQLFASNRELARGKHVFLIEDPASCVDAHACLVPAQDWHRVDYLEVDQAPSMAAVMERACGLRCERVHIIDPTDDWLERRVTREANDARRWLQDFVTSRLPSFGAYQDTISTHDSALFHSVLTPMLRLMDSCSPGSLHGEPRLLQDAPL